MTRKTKTDLKKEYDWPRKSRVLLESAADAPDSLLVALDSFDEVIYMADPDTCEILWLNSVGRSAWGNNLIGRKCHEVFKNRPEPCAFCTRDETFRDCLGKSDVWEYRNEGNGNWYRCSNKTIRWIDGRMVRFGIAVDITERKEAEEELRRATKRQKHLADIIENSEQPLGIGYPDGSLGLCNSAFCELTGYSMEELKGISWNTILTPPEWLESEYAALALLEDTGKPVRYEKEYIHKDGHRVPVELLAHIARDKEGAVQYLYAFITDITERRRGEEKIRLSEKRFEDIALSSGDWIWEVDVDGKYTFASGRVKEILGYASEEIIGMTPFEMMPRDEAKRVGEFFEQIAAHKEPIVDLENMTLAKDGRIVHLLTNGVPIFDDNGDLAGYRGVDKDITKQKETEVELHHQEILMEEMSRIAHIGAWEFDPDTGEGSWTDEVARIHDLSPRDKTSMEKGLSFYRGKSCMKIERAVKEAIDAGKPYDLELELLTVKGVHKWVRTIGNPIFDGGKVVRVRGSIQDITKCKKAEKELHEALDIISRSSSVLFTWKNAEGWPVVFVSENVRSLLGYKAKELMRDEVLFANCIHVQDRARVAEEVAQLSTQEQSEEFVHQPYRIISRDGSEKLVSDRTFIVRDNDGHITHYQGILEDITTQRSLEEQLRQAQKMESVGRLAGGVAHDFNNMLSVILGYAELAMGKLEPGEPLFDDLNEIYQAGQRSTEIVRQLLAFARKQTVAPRVLNLNDCIENTLKMLRRLIGEDIDVAWRPDSDAWPVEIDPSQLDQILANLCVNARDAMKGVGKLTIETKNTIFDKGYCAAHAGFVPGKFVLLAVSDNGHGMTPEVVETIFEPFFTTKDQHQGTGLGLSTVYGIIKQNNGFVNVYSEPGEGTTFKIYLPRHKGAPAEADCEVTQELSLSQGEYVLLVEDDLSLLKLCEKMLKSMGYHVLLAESVGEAITLSKMHANELRLLITDVVMPEMNGRQLSEQIKQHCPNLKVLFVSGYTANVIAHRCVLEKGVKFLAKPFSKHQLAQKVRETLDHSIPKAQQ